MKVPELLSPAGTPETAMAAFDGGADAVYCGLGRFNARERAGNFTPDSMGRIIEFAHRNGKKVYLTLNTLLREQELPQVMELLDEVNNLKPDALIVQDPGTLYLVQTYFPDLCLHASTQMGFHNSAGLRTAAEMGFRRVILERQVTLAELRKIMKKASLEVEVFLYGSLCCSLSGRCLLSAFTDAESGNRGRCKQPCRRRWNGRFQLSPADLNGIHLLPELRRLGVSSLKIEGRLRPPEYVWKTARAFRLLLDGPAEPEPERMEEAETLLNSAAGRRHSTGFFFPGEWKNLIQPDRIGTFGIPVAEVIGGRGTEWDIRTTGRLHLGDRLRVVPANGGDGETFSLVRLAVGRKPQTVVRAEVAGRIAIPVPVKPGDSLFKIGENGFDFTRRLNALPERTMPVDLQISASGKHWKVVAGNAVWETECDFAPAEKHALSIGAVKDAFSSGVPAPWRTGCITVRLDGSFFVPAAELKRLRREFWAFAAEKLSAVPEEKGRALLAFFRDYRREPEPVQPLAEKEEYTIPGFCAEGDLEKEKQRIRAAYNQGVRRFRASSWYAFDLVKELSGIEIVTAFPVPAGTSAGCRLLQKLGVCGVESDPELTAGEWAALQDHSPLPVRRSAEPVPVLATRLRLSPGHWRGTRCDVKVEYDAREGLSKVYAGDPAGK